MIPETETNAEDHLDYSDDDGELHLNRIGESDLVLRYLPDLNVESIENEKNIDVRSKTTRLLTGSSPNGYGVPEYICW